MSSPTLEEVRVRAEPPAVPTRLFLVAAVALAVAFVVQGYLSLTAPVSYDEGYNLQVVRHLVEHASYATDGATHHGTDTPYDALISTGPTLLLPTAALVGLLGEHVIVYRVLSELAFVLLAGAWGLVGWRLAGRGGLLLGAAAVLLVDTTTSHLQPGMVLGEVPAALLILVALILAGRPRTAGVLIGLAALTKVLSLLALPGVVLLVVLAGRQVAPAVGARRGIRHLVEGIAGPLLAWQAVRFATLGVSGGLVVDRAFLHFLRTGGSGFSVSRPAVGVLGRLDSQVEVLSWCGVGLLLGAVAVGARYLGVLDDVTSGPARGSLLVLLGGLLAALTVETWWLFVSDRDWVRHSLLAAYLGLPAVLLAAYVLLVRGPAGRRTRLAAGVVAVALLVPAILGRLVDAAHETGPTLAQQRQVAASIARITPSYGAVRWDDAPEIALLGHLRAHPVQRGDAWVLLPPDPATPEVIDRSRTRVGCGPVVVAQAGYRLCHPVFTPAAPPG